MLLETYLHIVVNACFYSPQLITYLFLSEFSIIAQLIRQIPASSPLLPHSFVMRTKQGGKETSIPTRALRRKGGLKDEREK